MTPTRLLAEALLVAAAGLAIGWAGNALSPRGLRVDRDYFPRAPSPAPTSPATMTTTPATPVESGPGTEAQAAPATAPADGNDTADASDASGDAFAETFQRLRARGLEPFDFAQAKATFEDPMHAAGAYVFLDARHDEEYELGHIPGAYVFDHYHMERYLNEVMALAPSTMRMVVYCSGGQCEDSEFAAATLAGLLPDPSVLRVYVGGITEWQQRGMPVETGARGSGRIVGGTGGGAGGGVGGPGGMGEGGR